MLPKRSHLWECKVNKKETSLYENSSESIEVNAYLILMMRWKIIEWSKMYHDVWVECNDTLY